MHYISLACIAKGVSYGCHQVTCIALYGCHLVADIWYCTWRRFANCSFMDRHTTPERQRSGANCEEFDYPPMDPGCFSPSTQPPPWLGPPPPYEVAIKVTCSSTQLRRAYSDTHLASEPLFGRSREISFEVWRRPMFRPPSRGCQSNRRRF